MINFFFDLETWLFTTISEMSENLPNRWKRWLAIYYPDARIRKLFWQQTCVEMGDGTYANLGMLVSDDYTSGECLLSIGCRVSIAPGVVFSPYSCPNNSIFMQNHPEVATRLIKREKIIVEDDVWIGANAVILPGVRIGRFSIIGAGSVITKDVSPYSIMAGVPARVIRQLSPLEIHKPNL